MLILLWFYLLLSSLSFLSISLSHKLLLLAPFVYLFLCLSYLVLPCPSLSCLLSFCFLTSTLVQSTYYSIAFTHLFISSLFSVTFLFCFICYSCSCSCSLIFDCLLVACLLLYEWTCLELRSHPPHPPPPFIGLAPLVSLLNHRFWQVIFSFIWSFFAPGYLFALLFKINK